MFWLPEPFPGRVSSGVRNFDVVAPYWTDNDIRREENVSYEVFQLQNTGSYADQLLDDISGFIREHNISSDFTGCLIILAEWKNVHPYPHGDREHSDDDTFLEQVLNCT